MSNAVAGVGTLFRKWNTTTGAWVNIAEVNSITGPTMTRETIDVTSLDSTGGYRDFIGSFRDGGTISLSMNFTNTTYDTMKEDFEDATLQSYEIVLPDTDISSFEFDGFVTECPISIPTDDKISSDVTIKISGKVVFQKGSGSSGSA